MMRNRPVEVNIYFQELSERSKTLVKHYTTKKTAQEILDSCGDC